MSSLVVEAKTIEDAVAIACRKLCLTESQVRTEVLQEPKSLFFGFINKKARVKVERAIEVLEEVKLFLQGVLDRMSISDISIDLDNKQVIRFNGQDLGRIIGKSGTTINALEYLAQQVSRKISGKELSFSLDAGDYRKVREQYLRNLADRLLKKAIYTGNKVKLEPMFSRDRKVIHSRLQNNKRAITKSEGKEPWRYVVITSVEGPKKLL